MITEIFRKQGFGRRIRKVMTPTPGAKRINAKLYSLIGVTPTPTEPEPPCYAEERVKTTKRRKHSDDDFGGDE